MTHTGRLDVVNGLPDAHAAEQLRACNASPRWIEQVLAHRPYADLDTVLDTAEHVARDLDWTEVRRALDAHPRIGERATGASTEAQWSRRGQTTLGAARDPTPDGPPAGN